MRILGGALEMLLPVLETIRRVLREGAFQIDFGFDAQAVADRCVGGRYCEA